MLRMVYLLLLYSDFLQMKKIEMGSNCKKNELKIESIQHPAPLREDSYGKRARLRTNIQ